jgi:hypothetical protein
VAQLRRCSITQFLVQLIFPILHKIDHRQNNSYQRRRPTEEEATTRSGAVRRAAAAHSVPAALSPSRARGPVETAVKEMDADGRTAEEVWRLVPASGGAVLASTAMVSITAVTLLSVRGKTRRLLD